MNSRKPDTDSTLPKALWVWDNNARLSLPPLLLAWLGLLVAVCLASIFFVSVHMPARAFLAGFVASHVVVFGLPLVSKFTVRRGFVSLAHVVCWAPGLLLILFDSSGRTGDPFYAGWAWIVCPVLLISLGLDLRDAIIYLRFVLFRPSLGERSNREVAPPEQTR